MLLALFAFFLSAYMTCKYFFLEEGVNDCVRTYLRKSYDTGEYEGVLYFVAPGMPHVEHVSENPLPHAVAGKAYGCLHLFYGNPYQSALQTYWCGHVAAYDYATNLLSG